MPRTTIHKSNECHLERENAKCQANANEENYEVQAAECKQSQLQVNGNQVIISIFQKYAEVAAWLRHYLRRRGR